MGRRQLDRKGRAKNARFVLIHHWMMDCAAYQDLDANARCIYVEFGRYYNGSNNGSISYSVRQAAEELKIGKGTAHKAIRSLIDHGFIVPITVGAFRLKKRHATEWRMTEHKCDLTGALPTKEFMRWTPPAKQDPSGILYVYPTPNREEEKTALTVRLQVPSRGVAA